MSSEKTRKTPAAIREGAWLVAAMEKARLKNTDIVDQLGLNTENLVSQWRTGNCPMTDLQLLQIGRILDVDVYAVRPSLCLYAELVDGRHYLDGLSGDEITDVVKYIGLLRGNRTRGEMTMKPRIVKIKPKGVQRNSEKG